MRFGYRRYTPDKEDLFAGERCHKCGTQLKYDALDAPCPSCGSTTRRLPRLKGQVVSGVIDALNRPDPDPAEGYPFKTRGGH